MTVRRYADTPAPAWVDEGDPRDKGALRLFGAFVQNISTTIGWGTSSTSCDVTLIDEIDRSSRTSTFQEPKMGSLARVAIPNTNQANNASLYDANDPIYTFSFIGMVSSIDNTESGSGKVKTVRLTGLKDILKNIPVVLNKNIDASLDKLNNINNVVYAYPDVEIDPDDNTSYRNDVGLKMSPIQEAVENKVFTFFETNRYDSNLNIRDMQEYEVDMSLMFGKRNTNPLSSTTRSSSSFWLDKSGRFGAVSDLTPTRNAEIINSMFDDLIDGDHSPDNDLDGDTYRDSELPRQYDENVSRYDVGHVTENEAGYVNQLVSYNFRIGGEYKSLLEVIDEAMTGSGLDWFVYAYEKADPLSIKTEAVNNRVVIKIVPIPRNDFNSFTKAEFDKFIGEFEDLTSSKMFGTELANEESNRIFYGPHIELYQRVKADNLKQFWGFKKPDFGVEEVGTITDRYGQRLQVRGGINKNPTFDFSTLPEISMHEEVFSDKLLKSFLTSILNFSESEVASLNRTQLLALLNNTINIGDTMTFDINDQFDKFSFYMLAGAVEEQSLFDSLLTSVYNYVDFYDTNKDQENDFDNMSPSIGPGKVNERISFSNVFLFGHNAVNGTRVQIGEDTSVHVDNGENLNLRFDFNINGINTINIEDMSNRDFQNTYVTIKVYFNARRKGAPFFSKKIYLTKFFDTNYVAYSVVDPYTPGDSTIKLRVDLGKLFRGRLETVTDRNKKLLLFNNGLHLIEVSVTPNIKHVEANATWNFMRIWVEHFIRVLNEDNSISFTNPYDRVRNGGIYKLARYCLVKFFAHSSIEARSLTPLKGSEFLEKVSRRYSMSNTDVINIFTRYQSGLADLLKSRISQVFNIVREYINQHFNKTYYRSVSNTGWFVASEAWDGVSGNTISNSHVRGKFINKETGKMPCLYRIHNALNIAAKQKGNDLLFIRNKNNTGPTTSLYGRANAEIHIISDEDTIEGVAAEQDRRIVVFTMTAIPEAKTIDPGEASSIQEKATKSENLRHMLELVATETLDDNILSLHNFLESISSSDTGLTAMSASLGIAMAKLPINPSRFYLPTIHEYARYGPWILDSRGSEDQPQVGHIVIREPKKNRSNYGITTISNDDTLSPWKYRSYGEVQNHLLNQNENALLTEHRMNRGQITVGDIPRFNIGHKIGEFSNISSISISYGTGGVTTTYSLTSFGAGQKIKEQRREQKIIKRLRNVEKNVQGVSEILTRADLEKMLAAKRF